jgi:hypothetical protein
MAYRRFMVRAAAAAKAANGVAQAKPRLKTMLAMTSNAIQTGRRQWALHEVGDASAYSLWRLSLLESHELVVAETLAGSVDRIGLGESEPAGAEAVPKTEARPLWGLQTSVAVLI